MLSKNLMTYASLQDKSLYSSPLPYRSSEPDGGFSSPLTYSGTPSSRIVGTPSSRVAGTPRTLPYPL